MHRIQLNAMTQPSQSNLALYLTDHLAGSIAAIALLNDLEKVTTVAGIRDFCSQLKLEIQSDQAVLDRLIALLQAEPNLTQRCGAWLVEKVAALRLGNLVNPSNALGLMEAFELIALGIEGKRLLWRALDYTVAEESRFREFDFTALAERAAEQGAMVEKWRIEMARSAFGLVSERP